MSAASATTGTAAPSGFRPRRWLHSRIALLIAFAFSVMADPVSSVAYAIEAALHALDGRLSLLVPAMIAVVFVVALVVASYHHLVGRFPEGGGSAAATSTAFGESWAFVPMAALIVDFILTIAISVSAGASAIISYVPAVAPWRIPLALGLLCLVAFLMRFGHLGRAVFAVLTLVFIGISVAVLTGIVEFGTVAKPAEPLLTHGAPLTVALAFPVAMALATGVEAPSSAIAQLGQLDDAGRRSFGRWALWLTLGIVGTLTIALAYGAVRLGVGLPEHDSTLVADIARETSSSGVFAAFQGATALLLLSAASSSFQAGPGLLKALARSKTPGGSKHGVLPSFLGVINKHHVPMRAVVVFLVASAAVVAGAGARDQRLVLFYAVAVFVSFLMGLIAMATFAWRDREWGWLVINCLGALAVLFTLIANLTRPAAIGSLGATFLVAGGLYYAWVKAGRPTGAAHAVIDAEVAAEPENSVEADVEPTTEDVRREAEPSA